MSLRKSILFGKLLVLLFLMGNMAAAKPTSAKNGFSAKGSLSLNKTGEALHKNMLQPRAVHVGTTAENTVKPINHGFAAFSFNESTFLILQPSGRAKEILQDANRCESVSKLLFPFHYFW